MVTRQKAVDTVASSTRPNSEDGVKVSLHHLCGGWLPAVPLAAAAWTLLAAPLAAASGT
jgi:hypothetical protein